MLPSRLASLAGWIPVAIVFGQHLAAPAAVRDGSMSPTLRGPGGGGAGGSREDDDDEDDDGDRRRRSLQTSPSASTAAPPPPPRQEDGDGQRSLFSVLLSGGDVVLVDKLAARTQRYRRGDVVLIRSLDDPRKTLIRRLVALEGDWVAPAAALEAAGGSGGSSPASSGSSSSSSSASASSASSSSSPSAVSMFPRSAPRAEVPKGHVWVEGDSPERAAAAAGGNGGQQHGGGGGISGGGSPVGLGGTPFFLPPQHPSDGDTAAGSPVPAALIDGVVRRVLWPASRAGELLPRPARSGRVVRLAAVGGGGR